MLNVAVIKYYEIFSFICHMKPIPENIKTENFIKNFSINVDKHVGSYVPYVPMYAQVELHQRHYINYKEAIKKFTEILAFETEDEGKWPEN